MPESKIYIKHLLANKDILTPRKEALFNDFVSDESVTSAAKIILENQKLIMDKWTLKNRINDIVHQQVIIPNATVNKYYETKIDFEKLNWNDLTLLEIEGLQDLGLEYDNTADIIKGTPVKSGDLKIKLKFRIESEPEDSVLNEKFISLVINPDPKSLWKDISSDKNDPYWKEDNVAEFGKLGKKNIVVSSKRGRSHANVGSFRDDDYSFTHFDTNGWSLVVVSDGAGSAKLSRQGSHIACNGVIEYFSTNLTEEILNEFDSLLKEYKEGSGVDTQKKLNRFVYNNLGKAALSVHKKLEQFAASIEVPIKDLHSTLIFTLFKKYEFGYALLSFGVGDCPIGLLNKDITEITLMNWLDVGEFGGGTRFITMPEIFNSDKFATRFGFKLIDDFSYLMLMTDGIYDPKFNVEANLEKIEAWKEFLLDLQGNNPEKHKVDFDKNNKEIADQLSKWMDFWSPGNHDDRTLAVIY